MLKNKFYFKNSREEKKMKMRTLFAALLVFKAIGISRSEECDVRMWYLKLTSEGIFNREMTSDQIIIKRMIDDLVATSKTDPKARKVDCEVLAMYLDMFKPESEEQTQESVSHEEDTTEIPDEQVDGNENTGHQNEIMDERNHDQNIIDETITIDPELPSNDRNESSMEFKEISLPNVETKIDGEEENTRMPTDTAASTDHMEILHEDETEVGEKDPSDDHTIIIDDRTEEIKVSLPKSQPELTADVTSREQLIDLVHLNNGVHVTNADKLTEVQNSEGGIGTQAKKESHQLDQTPENIQIKNVITKVNTTSQTKAKQHVCNLDIANIFKWQSKGISSHKYEAKNNSNINKTEMKLKYKEILEYNLNSCQNDSPNILVRSPIYYLMHLSKSNDLHFCNKEHNICKQTSDGKQPKVGEIERQTSLSMEKEGKDSVKTNNDKQNDTSASKGQGIRANTILNEDKSKQTEYKENEQPSAQVAKDEMMRQSDSQESTEFHDSFHKENLNSAEINYQEPTGSLQQKEKEVFENSKDPRKQEESSALKAHKVSNIKSDEMNTQVGRNKTQLDTLSISERENKELYTPAKKEGEKKDQLDSATAKGEGNNGQLENLTITDEDNKEKTNTRTKKGGKNVGKKNTKDTLALKNGEKKELEILTSKDEENKEQIGTLTTKGGENSTQIDALRTDGENKEQLGIMTTNDRENTERTDTPTKYVKNKEQPDILTTKDIENREQTDTNTSTNVENKERTDIPISDVKNKEQLDTWSAKEGENRERTDTDVRNKEQRDELTSKNGENEEQTDTLTTDVQNKEQLDTLTAKEVENKERTDTYVKNKEQLEKLTSKNGDNKEQTDTLTTDVKNKEQLDALTAKNGDNEERTDRDVKNKEQLEKLTSKNGDNKEQTDTLTTDVKNKEQLDTLTAKNGDNKERTDTDVKNKEQLDTLTTKEGENKEGTDTDVTNKDKLAKLTSKNGENKEQTDTLTAYGKNKEQNVTLTTNLENKEQNDTMTTDVEKKEQTDTLSSNVQNDEQKDTLAFNGENTEPTDTPTTDAENKEQFDTLTKKNGDTRVRDTSTTETENNQPLDTLTTKDGENKEEHMQIDQLVLDTLNSGEQFDSLVNDGVSNVQTDKVHNGDIDESEKHKNMQTFKDYITAKTDEYTNKIQTLELMVIKLENQILTERLNKQNNSSTITDMEIHILKLENDLLRLNISYNELRKEQDMLKKSNRGYLELDNKSQTSSSNKFPGIGNSVSGTSLSNEYQTKIMHLSQILKNQSLTVDKLKSKSEYLEDQNRLLFQMVMNQTVLMSQIMSRVQDLTEQNLQHRAEAQQLRREIEMTTRVQTEHHDDQMPGHLAQFVKDGRSSESIHEREFPQEKHKHNNPIANNVRVGPLHDFNMVVNNWCSQSKYTCHLGVLMTTNCIPFSNVVWIRCQNDYINVNIKKPDMKSGTVVNKKQSLNENEKPAISSKESYTDTSADANEDKPVPRKESLIQHGDPLILSNDQKTEHVVNENKDILIEYNEFKIDRKIDKERHVNDVEEIPLQNKENNTPNTDIAPNDKKLNSKDVKSPSNDVSLDSSSKDNDDGKPQNNMKNLENKHTETSTKKSESENKDIISSRDGIKNNAHGTIPHGTHGIQKEQSNQEKAQETKHQVGTNKQTGKSQESIRKQDNKPENPKQESNRQTGPKIKQNREGKKQHLKKEIKRFPIKYTSSSISEPKDCYDHYKMGNTRNNVFRIKPHGLKWAIQVYCDMKNGGWTVIQKRQDGTTKFLRDWEEYKSGFGGIYGEHWLGNDNIHYLTNQDHYSLQIDLMDWEKTSRVANYDYFMVEDEQQGYRIHVDGYSGDAGDGMAKHHQHKFSTVDVDNDKVVKEFGGSCAKRFSGAWWYYKCYMSNLNGKYYRNGEIPEKMFDGITWKPWTGPNYSLRRVEMKIRPASVKASDDV